MNSFVSALVSVRSTDNLRSHAALILRSSGLWQLGISALIPSWGAGCVRHHTGDAVETPKGVIDLVRSKDRYVRPMKRFIRIIDRFVQLQCCYEKEMHGVMIKIEIGSSYLHNPDWVGNENQPKFAIVQKISITHSPHAAHQYIHNTYKVYHYKGWIIPFFWSYITIVLHYLQSSLSQKDIYAQFHRAVTKNKIRHHTLTRNTMQKIGSLLPMSYSSESLITSVADWNKTIPFSVFLSHTFSSAEIPLFVYDFQRITKKTLNRHSSSSLFVSTLVTRSKLTKLIKSQTQVRSTNLTIKMSVQRSPNGRRSRARRSRDELEMVNALREVRGEQQLALEDVVVDEVNIHEHVVQQVLEVEGVLIDDPQQDQDPRQEEPPAGMENPAAQIEPDVQQQNISIRVGHRDHPTNRLTPEELDVISDLVEDMILRDASRELISIPSVRQLPTDGQLELTAANNFTTNWLERALQTIAANYPIAAHVVEPTERRRKFSVKIKNREITERDFFRRLRVRNPTLNLTTWKIIGNRPIAGTSNMLLTVSMGEAAALELATHNNQLAYIMGTLEFRPIGQRNGGEAAVQDRVFGYRR